MSLTNKSKKDTYKDLFYLNNSNNGFPATTPQRVIDGAGNSSSLKLSQDKVILQPTANNTSDMLQVQNKNAEVVLNISTSTQLVKVHASQNYVNTQYKTFKCVQLNPTANTWYPMTFDGGLSDAIPDNFGTGSEPATTFTATYTMLNKYWYVHDNITIDAVKVLHMGDDSASIDTLSYSLNSFTLDSSGAGSGDLSSGVVNANSSSQVIDNADMDLHSLSLATPDIDAGKVILMMVRGGSSTNNDITASVHIKFHLR